MTVEWVSETTFIIPFSKKRVISLRLDSDVVNRYDRLVAKLRLRNINITRTQLFELILTKLITERQELLAELLF